MKRDYIDGIDLRRAIILGTKYLEARKDDVDALNVFPVPDGDTGTNMFLTLASAAKEVEKIKENSVTRVASAAAAGSLMGARGNSGVILSQLVRGFSSSVEGKIMINSIELAEALREAAKIAYKAVLKPVEGTILTVAREAAEAAYKAAKSGKDILHTLEMFIEQGGKTLKKTPDLLKALKEAGVVDAGGQGLIWFAVGAFNGLKGEELDFESIEKEREAWRRSSESPVKETLKDERFSGVSGAEDIFSIKTYTEQSGDEAVDGSTEGGEEEYDLEFRYCTEFLIKGRDLSTESIKADLINFGDSMLVVGSPDLVKVHIHTNNPGIILEYGVKLGVLSSIQVSNMAEQHNEMVAKAQSSKGDGDEEGFESTSLLSSNEEVGEQPEDSESGSIAVIAVAMGEGVEKILKSLGVTVVVQGGQTMNPSIEDIVSAIKVSGKKECIILPNNSNIILTAKQAVELLNVNAAVIPTKSIPQGIAALLAMRVDADLASNEAAMTEAISEVKTGEVTFAVRNSKYNGFTIDENDFIGISDGELRVAGKVCEEVVKNLLTEMVSEDDEIITILFGADVKDRDAIKLSESIAEDFPNCEVELQYGGQPLYYYIISVE